jgi:hypothetical protein
LFVCAAFALASERTLLRAARILYLSAVSESSTNVKAIAGGVGGAAACLLLFGAVIIRKTYRTLAEKDAAKRGATAHELQLKDRRDGIKLAAGAGIAVSGVNEIVDA